MIFLSCALFWKEVLAHAELRVSSLAHKAILPSLSHSFPLSLQNGNTALAIAKRLGYISVVDTLKVVTEEVTTTTTVSTGWRLICSCPLGFPATYFSLSVCRFCVELLLLNAL